jgi:hypothetical protein
MLLEHFAGRLECHTPWASGREVSHLFRGAIDLEEANQLLADVDLGWLRIVDNGVVHRTGEMAVEADGDVPLHAYHLIPAAASKARGVARHMQARGYAPEDCIAVGDSREDLGVAGTVQMFWLVANALERDPTLADDVTPAVEGRPPVRIASGAYGAGVYEAVVTTLAERN